MSEAQLVIPRSSAAAADVERVGPKAANLAALTRAGLPTPGGFCLTADAYRRQIAEIGLPGGLSAPDGADVVEGAGRHLVPAFVDPHVHFRVPGQEHKEDLETGTQAAAAGGFCAVLAMPNTDPVIDSAPLLRSLRDAAVRDARIPIGVMPSMRASTKAKWSAHWSVRGFKNRTNVLLSQSIEPTSLPLAWLQNTHAMARLSAIVAPPCFSLIMWSASQP